jgi:flagellar hook-associated protein 3 FlgL
MRISTNMLYQKSTTNLQKTTERLDKASEQLSTGEKFSSAGQDPIGMAQKISLSSKIESFQQYNSNGNLLDSNLTLEGTVLSSSTTTLQSAYTLVQKAMNGSMSTSDKASIASELTQLRDQLYDQMNSKNADGEYIFGGNQSQTQPFLLDSSGTYQFQGDTGQRLVQVAPSVQIAANDSGLTVFQSVPTRRTATANTSNLTLEVKAQSEYNDFFRNSYDFNTAANNVYTINTTAGSPDQYTLTDSSGTTLQTGTYTQGSAFTFNGLSLKMDVAAGGAAQTFTLDPPTNDNVLNTLTSMIAGLKDSSLSDDDFSTLVADSEVHIQNALDRIDMTQGAIGGRQNNLSQILDSNTALSTISQDARANVSEVDMYEAISTVTQEQNALSAAQQAFTKVTKSTLFDYL